jgi:hypothetical protein
MISPPSDGMRAWFWKIVQDECHIQKTDVRIVFLIDEPPANSGGRPSKAQVRAAWPRFSQEIRESSPSAVLALQGDTLYPLTGITQTILDARGYVLDKDFFHSVTTESWEKIGEYKNKGNGHQKGDPRYGWQKTTLMGGLLGQQFDGVVIPSYGLDHIRMEQFAVRPAFKEDVRRCKRAIDGELHMLDNRLEQDGFYTDFCTKRFGRDLTELHVGSITNVEWGDVIAVDIETHGVGNEVIDLVSFSDGKHTASLEWSTDARHFMDYLFALPGRYFAVHNSPFDIPRLIANGVSISDHVLDHRLVDTMFGAVVLQPDLHKSLARAITIYHDLKPWKGQRGSMWSELSKADPRFYSAKDAFVTAWLAISIITVMKNLGTWNLFMGEGDHPGPGVCATIRELTTMNREGIRLDRPAAERHVARLERKQLRLEKIWGQHFPGTNPASTQQLQDLMYGEWGLPVQRTKSKEAGATTNELALVRLQYYVGNDYARKQHPGGWTEDSRCTPRFFDLVLKLRGCAKTISTYVQPAAMNEEAWVHPSYMPVSKDQEHEVKDTGLGLETAKGTTCTGRLATYGPNIQNQPKTVRFMYVPDTLDMTFIQADYKSAELYVMAYMAGDDRLLEDLRSGDMHSRNAVRFNTSRKTAKNITYAGQYLAGAQKVSEMLLEQEHQYVPVEECKRILGELAKYYYKTHAYKMHLVQLCESKKYIKNAFGRIRFFHAGNAPAAVDFIPQSTVADVLWCVLSRVAAMARRFGGRMTTTVHDSIMIQVPSANVAAAAAEMKAIMEQRFDIVKPGFYIPVEVEVAAPGKSWGDVAPFEMAA